MNIYDMAVMTSIRVKVLYLSMLFLWIYEPYSLITLTSSKLIAIDGDTVLHPNGQRLRLIGIDAPEILQQSKEGVLIGEFAKNKLSSLIQDKKIKIEYIKKGHFGRWLVRLYDEKIQINKALVKSGWALSYWSKEFKHIEKGAKWKRAGLWKTQGFVKPWAYRKKIKSTK